MWWNYACVEFVAVVLILALTNCFSTKVIGATVDDNRDISSCWFGAVDDDSLFWHGLGSDFIDGKRDSDGKEGFDSLSLVVNISHTSMCSRMQPAPIRVLNRKSSLGSRRSSSERQGRPKSVVYGSIMGEWGWNGLVVRWCLRAADETSAFPGAARASPNVSPNVFFRSRPDSNQWVRIGGLKDVAWGPNVKTGVDAPSYSGGFAVWLGVLDVGCGCFLSLGG
jgi:hypothetical protein